MSNPNKTIADIVAEMRNVAESAIVGNDVVLASTVARFADDIEAAVKREKAIVEADALAVGGMVEASRKRKHSGDAAALRKALEEILRLAKVADYDGGRDWNDDITVKIIDIADRALAAPARNCDRPECSTLEKATRIWIQEEVAKCDSKATMADIRTFDVWTYAPATEQKGENDGSK